MNDDFDEIYANVAIESDIKDDRMITLMVNTTCWKKKPEKYEFAEMQPFFKKMTITFSQLEEYLMYGCTVRPAILEEGKTKGEYFIGQKCFFVDVDGTHTVQKSLDICREYGIKANIIYPTFHYTPSNQRHRLVFIAPEIILDADLRDRIQKRLIEIFRADPSSRDRARQFCGGKILFWADERARLDIDKLLEADFRQGGEKLAA